MNTLAPSTTSDAINRIRIALDRTLELALQQERRESDANARLADLHKLLWMWVAQDWPSGPAVGCFVDSICYGTKETNKARIQELATVLGVDLHPAIVANEMQKRADAARAATEEYCVCAHERSLHDEHGHGACRGHHRGARCARFEIQPKALTP